MLLLYYKEYSYDDNADTLPCKIKYAIYYELPQQGNGVSAKNLYFSLQIRKILIWGQITKKIVWQSYVLNQTYDKVTIVPNYKQIL